MTEAIAFTPANGIESRKTIVLRHLSAADYGELVPYELLIDALDGVSLETVQRAVGSAKMTLEHDYRKSAMAVARQGYRIIQPGEHMAAAVGHQVKSRRALQRALSVVENVDMSRLTEGERAAITLGATSLSLQIDYMRRNDLRAARHEKLIEAVTEQSTRSEAEISALKKRLAELEGRT